MSLLRIDNASLARNAPASKTRMYALSLLMLQVNNIFLMIGADSDDDSWNGNDDGPCNDERT